MLNGSITLSLKLYGVVVSLIYSGVYKSFIIRVREIPDFFHSRVSGQKIKKFPGIPGFPGLHILAYNSIKAAKIH